ncbi:uncharacterized protein LOC127713985 [Mytilus californianus]|uniref:uncharacterized protein LOC127713985 n=1 Tax=Mytilus californianus TaxID=6549 RepID=UPI002246562D|nr:uncharacterized protein LOC127713985 [Mytilus californianus]
MQWITRSNNSWPDNDVKDSIVQHGTVFVPIEISPSIWRPENLLCNFMRCFKRLIYSVENSACPHYFIPENNLFENKIKENAQQKLINKLHILNSYVC